MLWDSFREIDVQPNIVCEVIDKSTLLQFVEHELGIAMVSEWVGTITGSGVTFVPFETGKDCIELHVAFRKSGSTEALERFVKIAKSTTI